MKKSVLIILLFCFTRVYAMGYDIQSKVTYESGYIPVLMYHSIENEVKKENHSNTVKTTRFKSQLEALLNNGYTPITFQDLNLYKLGTNGLPAKPFIVTFDDGYLNKYTVAYPILKELKVNATYFVSTKYVGVNTGNEHFTWEQAKEMEDSGFIDIQSHSATHTAFTTLTNKQVIEEIQGSFKTIEDKLGKRDVKVLAYPQFKNTKTTQELVKKEGVFFQMTNLAKKGDLGDKSTNVKRIHVHNNTTPELLLKEIQKLTSK